MNLEPPKETEINNETPREKEGGVEVDTAQKDQKPVEKNQPSREELQFEREQKLANIINSKKYFVSIKEKHYWLRSIFHTKKRKLTPKTHPKTVLKAKKTKDTELVKKRRNQIAFVLLSWVILFILVDTGVLKTGWNLPFSIFNRKNSTPPAVVETREVELITE